MTLSVICNLETNYLTHLTLYEYLSPCYVINKCLLSICFAHMLWQTYGRVFRLSVLTSLGISIHIIFVYFYQFHSCVCFKYNKKNCCNLDISFFILYLLLIEWMCDCFSRIMTEKVPTHIIAILNSQFQKSLKNQRRFFKAHSFIF